MKLELDNDVVKDLVSEAIFQSFDEQKRNALIKEALKSLLQPASDGYNRGRSPLQEAFESALYGKARELADDAVRNHPEITKALDDLMLDAMRKFITDKRETLVKRMADAIHKGITEY